MNVKHIISKLLPIPLWKRMRLHGILMKHKHVSRYCEQLIKDYQRDSLAKDLLSEIHAKKEMESSRIVWQYWAQGYDYLPPVVDICVKSVDKYCPDCQIIRLDDTNLSEYLELPDYVLEVPRRFGLAFFSDLLRVILLSKYGGVWLDATVLLTGQIPQSYFDAKLFFFHRDPNEPNKEYWENSFAYYWGWSKGFRVNMLSSILFAKKGNIFISTLCGIMLSFSNNNQKLPDYFFFQILFDVLLEQNASSLEYCDESDCLPHYLMQICNDDYMDITLKKVLSQTVFHKLSYKSIDDQKLRSIMGQLPE